MKRVLLIISLFYSLIGMCQTYPVPQNLGRTPSTLVSTNSIRADQGLINGVFVDTTAANLLPYLKNYPGAMIYTTGNSTLNVRNPTATKWDQLGGSGSSINIYNSDGTLTGNRTVTLSTFALNFDRGANKALHMETGVTAIYSPDNSKAFLLRNDSITLTGVLPISGLDTDSLILRDVNGKLKVLAKTSISGTPAGNYGNVQLNRNGAFATGALDTIGYTTSSGLVVKNDGTFWGAGHFQLSSVIFNTDTVRGSGYGLDSDADLSGAALGLGGTPGDTTSFLDYYNTMRVRENSTLYKVKLYINGMPSTFFYIDVWRKVGANSYNRIGHENVIAQLTATSICNITLSTPVAVQEGDYFGISYKIGGSGASTYTTLTVASLTGIYYQQVGQPTSSAYPWESKSSSTIFFPIIGYVVAPNIMAIGNSIQAGALFNNTLAQTVTIDGFNYQPLKIVANNLGYTYQNMAIGGNAMTQIAARFYQDVVLQKPRFCLIEGGVNDIVGIGQTTTIVIDSTKSVIDQCIANGIIPVYTAILPTACTNFQSRQIDTVNAAVLAYVRALGGITIDSRAQMGQFRVGGPVGNVYDLKTIYDYGDGVHLNGVGDTAWASYIIDTLAAYVTPGPLITLDADTDGEGIIYSHEGNSLRLKSFNAGGNYSQLQLSPTETILNVTTGVITIPTYQNSNDTSSYKPLEINSSGDVRARTDWISGIAGSGAANRMTYWSGASTLTSTADITVDAANSRFSVYATSAGGGQMFFGKTSSSFGGLSIGVALDDANYFLRGSAGNYYINAGTGKTIEFRMNDTKMGIMSADKWAFGQGSSVTANTAVTIFPNGNTDVAVVVKGQNSQSGDLQRWTNNSDGILASVSSAGDFRIQGAFLPNNLPGTSGQVLTSAGAGTPPTWATPTTGTVTSVSGTANRITSTGGTTPVIDIAATYVGQTSITTLGTVGTGVWNGTTIAIANGGTGLTTLGTALQSLRVNAGATALEYYTPSTVATAMPINGLTAATGTNTINNVANNQEWQWNSLSSGAGLSLTTTSTAAASSGQRIFEIVLSGANANSAQATYGAYISNQHTGTTSVNTGMFLEAKNGASNVALELNGQLGIGQSGYPVTLPDASSLIDVVSTSKGVLFPRMTTTQRDAISAPVAGLLIYNTTDSVFNYYRLSGWTAVGSGGSSGLTVGTTTITSGTTTRILYDNAGVLGEYTLTGTGTVVAMQTLPSFAGTINTASVTNAYVAKTANYNVATSDFLINGTANSFDLTLPTAVSVTGKTYVLKNSGTGTVTVKTTSSQTLDGSLTVTLNQFDVVRVTSDGANWILW